MHGFRLGAVVMTVAVILPMTGCSGGGSGTASSADPSSGVTVKVDVSAGGPYSGAVGAPVTLAGSYAVAGQGELVANLGAVGRALQKYVAANGSYPPGALTDPAGKPLLSWRVLLLPHLGRADLYARFDLTKAWNDPANQALLAQIPAVYQRIGAPAGATDTGIVGAAGSGAVFGRNGPTPGAGVKPGEVTHGTNATLAAGPAGPAVSIPWTAPGDVDIALHAALGAADGLAGPTEDVTPLLYLDGTVYPMPNALSASYVRGWAGIANVGCSPPAGLSVALASAWDVSSDGSYAARGNSATFKSTAAGTYSVPFRVVDAYGGVHGATATVTVR